MGPLIIAPSANPAASGRNSSLGKLTNEEEFDGPFFFFMLLTDFWPFCDNTCDGGRESADVAFCC